MTHYRVRVLTPSGFYTKKRRVSSDGCTIVMQKETRKHAEWKFKFTPQSVYNVRKGPFRREYIDVFHDAHKAVNYDFTQEELEQPKLTRAEAKKIIDAEILRNRGKDMKTPTPMLSYIMLAMMFALVGLNFFMARRLGIF